LRYERIYDFKHQSLEQPNLPFLIPGDEIKVSCDYDTTYKNITTTFGENTDNEMCWSALMYYPAQTFTNAYTFPAPTLAQLNVQATPCLTASTQYSSFGVSQCAEQYFNDPVLYGIGTATGLNASYICNILQTSYPSSWANLISAWPTVCPSCYENQNCTENDLLVKWGQGFICPYYCNLNVGASVYPNVTGQPVAYNQRTICDGPSGSTFNFNNDFPAEPVCVVAGDFASSTNTASLQTLGTLILTDQNACPNLALLNLLSNCTHGDIDLTAGTTNCRASCRTATAAVLAAFQAMVPSPTLSQRLQCVSDYNATWAPKDADGHTWTEWTTLNTRLSGTFICDAAVSSAAQFAPAAVLLFLFFAQ